MHRTAGLLDAQGGPGSAAGAGRFSEQMEVRENPREMEQVMDAAIEAVTQETDVQPPVVESPVQEKKIDQER